MCFFFYCIYFQLHACYNASNDKYTIHRVIQAFETANFIRITSTGSDLAVLAGDLNSNPNEICYKLICLGANMIDSHSAVIIFLNVFKMYRYRNGLSCNSVIVCVSPCYE